MTEQIQKPEPVEADESKRRHKEEIAALNKQHDAWRQQGEAAAAARKARNAPLGTAAAVPPAVPAK